MKNILKYAFAAAMTLTGLAACEGLEDFDKTIDGAPNLVYANTGTDNMYTIKIVHRPEASTGEFFAEFGINCNTTRHGATTVDISYDAALVQSYNAENGTVYTALPREYLLLENTTLSLPEGALTTADSVKVTLQGDLAALTQREYLAPLRVRAKGIDASSVSGVVYVAVETEVNLIRPITATSQMEGFPATGRSKWSADCANASYLFDNNTSTSATFTSQTNNIVHIDMKETQLMTGLLLGSGSISAVSIEYSTDGENFSQAGTPVSGEYVTASSMMYIAFVEYIEARYLRLKINFSGSSRTLSEVNIYKLDTPDPSVYALTGVESPLTGKITHKKSSGSTSDLNASFKVYATHASQSGYSVTAVADNTLVAAYNTANNTSYAVLPAANLSLSNNPASIASGALASTSDIQVSLAGDLSSLTNKEGYLIPLRISATGAATSTSRGVVYVVVAVENNIIRPISSVNDMVGFPASGRSAWTADASNYGNMFDDNTGTSTNFSSSAAVLNIDMKQARLVTGLYFHAYQLNSLSIEYSYDGLTYETAGTPANNEYVRPSSSWSPADSYVAFYDYIEARYLRLRLEFSSSYYAQIAELNVYEIESEDPTVYTICGTDNVLSGSVVHTPAGTFNGVDASFDTFATVTSASGYTVGVNVNNALVAAYNSANGTSYQPVDASLVKLENIPSTISAGSNKSATPVKVSLDGDLTGMTDTRGYIIPLQLTSTDAVVSASRGVVYVIVTPVEDLFRKNFTQSEIEGVLAPDRSGWTITGDEYHSGSWEEILDGDESTFLRPWGSPLTWTIKFDRYYEFTGLRITARSDYSSYQPNAVMIEYSDNGEDFVELGTASTADGSLVRFGSSSDVAIYGSKPMLWIRVTASYGSNMGIGEFNIYTK